MLPYLEMCAASIADQGGVDFKHTVIDGQSTDGTVQWLEKQKGIRFVSEKDESMYDAVNKGFRSAPGDILSYLNCDEQYLPGALEHVKRYFQQHPEVDMVFGDMLLTRPDGSLIAYRKSYRPRWPFILAAHLYVPTCTMFFRQKIVDHGILFDLQYKANADADFVVRVLRQGFKVRYLRQYLAAFTLTGQNLSGTGTADQEAALMLRQTPGWIRKTRKLLTLIRFGEKFLSGAYNQKSPLQYDIFVKDRELTRKHFTADNPSYKWQWE